MNTYHYFHTGYIELEYDKDTKPRFIVITNRSRKKTDEIKVNIQDTVKIPKTTWEQFLHTAKQLEDVQLAPAAQDEQDRVHANFVIQERENDILMTIRTIVTERPERFITIEHVTYRKGRKRNHSSKVNIPWIHWPRFRWHVQKLKDEAEQVYDNSSQDTNTRIEGSNVEPSQNELGEEEY